MYKSIRLFLFVCLLLNTGLSIADDAKLVDLAATKTKDSLIFNMTIEGCFTKDILEAIMSGVPTTFSSEVILYQVRHFWLNKKISEINIFQTIRYDNLKKEYTITRSWINDEPYVTQSFDEAKRLMTEIKKLKLASLNNLVENAKYQIRARSELSEVVLPFYLHYFFFFVSFWNFETSWHSMDFIYDKSEIINNFNK